MATEKDTNERSVASAGSTAIRPVYHLLDASLGEQVYQTENGWQYLLEAAKVLVDQGHPITVWKTWETREVGR
jgi:hypothetical protein